MVKAITNMQNEPLQKIKPEKMGDFDRIADEFLPYLSLNSDQVDDIVNWENGKSYTVVFKIRQDGTRKDKVSGVVQADFKITAYKVLKPKTMDEMSDAEMENMQADALAISKNERESSPSINLAGRA